MIRAALLITLTGTAVLIVRKPAEVPQLPIKGGAVQVVLDPSVTGSSNAALDVLEVDAGSEVPPHVHETSDEILYVLEGHAVTTVGSTTLAAKAGDTIFIPKGQTHSAKFLAKTKCVQVYAPAGPEQRFKK